MKHSFQRKLSVEFLVFSLLFMLPLGQPGPGEDQDVTGEEDAALHDLLHERARQHREPLQPSLAKPRQDRWCLHLPQHH